MVSTSNKFGFRPGINCNCMAAYNTTPQADPKRPTTRHPKHLKYRQAYCHRDTQTGQPHNDMARRIWHKSKKSHTHVLLMTFGFSCTNCALYKSGAFLNRKIPVTKHAELGGHITLYIFILTSYSFSFHAHSSNGL